MEKIRLKNGTEFEVLPMGVDNLSDSRRFKIVSTLGYAETLQQFVNVENIETIEYIISDNSVSSTYMDCVGFKNIAYMQQTENDTLLDIYTVELGVNAVERKLKDMQSKIDKLELENIVLRQDNADLKELVDALVVSTLEV